MAMKSSSFSLLVKAMTNFGGHTGSPASPLPDDDPPFLLSCAVSEDAADLLFSLWWWWWLPLLLVLVPLLSCAPLSGEAIPLTPPLLCPLMALDVSEFLIRTTQHKIRTTYIVPYYHTNKSLSTKFCFVLTGN
jgi:hypothetical protein